MSLNSKKEIFSELRDQFFKKEDNGVKLSSFKNSENVVNEIKTLKIIELDNLDSFESYTNYDHFLIFKFNEDYYFCDTQLIPALENRSLIKLEDFNYHLRKDKIKKIDKLNKKS